MKKLLVVVDMQNDFIDGSLGTKEAQAIVPKVVEKIKEYQREGNPIVFTKDTHFDNYMDTQEGQNLPVSHCVKGTPGWEICRQIQDAADIDRCKVYEKETFGSPAYAADLAAGCYNETEEIELVGLCTDICVISNAMLTKTFLPETKVSVDAACCAGVTPDSHRNALRAMQMCQIIVNGSVEK